VVTIISCVGGLTLLSMNIVLNRLYDKQMKHGTNIILALEHYYSEKGKYPESLNVLKPLYIKPVHGWSNDLLWDSFEYEKDNWLGYHLYLHDYTGTSNYYNPIKRKWRYDH